MCTVSMVGDFYREKWRPLEPYIQPGTGTSPAAPFYPPFQKAVSPEEFEALKKEVQDMKKLLQMAKIYDEKNGEPNCEMDEKMKLLKDIAKLVGIDLDDILKK